MRVGFIGLGRMGGADAPQYGDAGHDRSMHDAREAATAPLLTDRHRHAAPASGRRRRRRRPGTRPGRRGRAGVTVAADLSGLQLAIAPTPTAHFGAGGIHKLGTLLGATGCSAAVIVTDAGLLSTPVIGAVRAALDEAGLPAVVFSGVHPNPTTDDVAAGAKVVDEVVAELAVASRASLVAVGGGSSIDAAKGIALAAVNVERGRDLDYRNEFAQPALPIIAVPTTAGTGAETNAFGVVTDPLTRRKFYIGHASTMPASAILDPELTIGLPPTATAATGVDALTHAIESYLSVRANPWSDGIALQVIAMAGAHLARSVADGTDLEARSAMLLASHMAGIGMSTTGLGLAHAIGHAIGGRHDLAHGVTLAMVLPQVLRFSEPVRQDRLASIAFALGVGDTGRDRDWNAAAAIDAVTSLRAQVGLAVSPADFGIGEDDFAAIAADALDDEVLANAPRQPSAAEIEQILAAAGQPGGGGLPLHRDQLYQRPAVPPASAHQGRAPDRRRYGAVGHHAARHRVGGWTPRRRAAPPGRAGFRPAQPACPRVPAAEPARVGHHRPDQVRQPAAGAEFLVVDLRPVQDRDARAGQRGPGCGREGRVPRHRYGGPARLRLGVHRPLQGSLSGRLRP